MNIISPSTFALSFLLSFAALIFYAYNRNRIVGGLTCAIVLALIPLAFYTYTEAIGRPRPLSLEVFGKLKGTVLHHEATEEFIFLYLAVEGEKEPLSISIPFTEELANKLYEMSKKAEEEGPLMFEYEFSWDRLDPKLYPLPVPKLPEKQAPEAPLQYKGRSA